MKRFSIFLCALLSALSCLSATYYVDASRPDDSGIATNWTTAKQTIQAAVNLAVDGDTVLVTNGVYDTGGAITPGYSLTNRVCITNAIIVQSLNGPDATLIQGAAGSNGSNDVDSVRGVFMTNGCSVAGFTIANGYTMDSGDNVFNRAGGGVWITTNCVISNCVLRNNMSVSYGGGVHLHRGGTVNNCVIRTNLCLASGGGAYIVEGKLNNCLIIENTSKWRGGGVYIGSNGFLFNSTVVSNYALESGGGVRNLGGTILNSIVWDNTTEGEGNNIHAYTTVQNTCSFPLQSGSGNIENTPQFIDITNGNYQLRLNSPCVNAGHNSYVSTINDLSGSARIAGSVVDMGAYERQDAGTDMDGDGMDDLWEMNQFNSRHNVDGSSNHDSDGQSDLQEYIAGTDPANGASYFAITDFTSMPSIRIEWDSVPGRVYSVYWSTNLIDGFEPLETNIPWTVDVFTNTAHAGEQSFYKVQVELE